VHVGSAPLLALAPAGIIVRHNVRAAPDADAWLRAAVPPAGRRSGRGGRFSSSAPRAPARRARCARSRGCGPQGVARCDFAHTAIWSRGCGPQDATWCGTPRSKRSSFSECCKACLAEGLWTSGCCLVRRAGCYLLNSSNLPECHALECSEDTWWFNFECARRWNINEFQNPVPEGAASGAACGGGLRQRGVGAPAMYMSKSCRSRNRFRCGARDGPWRRAPAVRSCSSCRSGPTWCWAACGTSCCTPPGPAAPQTGLHVILGVVRSH